MTSCGLARVCIAHPLARPLSVGSAGGNVDAQAQGARVVTLTAMDTEIFSLRDKYGR